MQLIMMIHHLMTLILTNFYANNYMHVLVHVININHV